MFSGRTLMTALVLTAGFEVALPHLRSEPDTPREDHPGRLALMIVASRPDLVRSSLELWMPFLREGTSVFLAMYDEVFDEYAEEWRELELPIRVYATSPGKTAKIAAQEVFLQGIQAECAVIWSGAEDVDWFMVADDDTFVNPVALYKILDALNPGEAHALGQVNEECSPVCGGAGLVLSRGAIRTVDWSALPACGKDMRYYDVALGKFMESQAVPYRDDPRFFAQSPKREHFAPKRLAFLNLAPTCQVATVHYANTTALMGAYVHVLLRERCGAQPGAWRPAGFRVTRHALCGGDANDAVQ